MPATVVEARPLDVSSVRSLATALAANVTFVVRGKPEVVELALVALLSGGHLLVEDLPGVGKTSLAKALARSLGGQLRRVQGTPDLLPSELTGVSVFSPADGSWSFRPGPLFSDVVLFDEINRATPRTQSALLEAMEERQVTVDGVTRALPDPFFLVATQNPFDSVGTFALVEGQRDRFALVVGLGHPGPDAERELLLGIGGAGRLDALEAVTDPDGVRAAQATVRSVHCDPSVADYVVRIGAATRADPEVRLGASPRATLALLAGARARAAMRGRPFVVPDDVKALAAPVLAHRLVLVTGVDVAATTSLVTRLVESLPPPRG